MRLPGHPGRGGRGILGLPKAQYLKQFPLPENNIKELLVSGKNDSNRDGCKKVKEKKQMDIYKSCKNDYENNQTKIQQHFRKIPNSKKDCDNVEEKNSAPETSKIILIGSGNNTTCIQKIRENNPFKKSSPEEYYAL